MIKGDSYQMMLDHLSHTITELGSSDNWAQFEVIILDKDKIYHKFNWQVEKYLLDGSVKGLLVDHHGLKPDPTRQFNLIIHRYNFVSLFQKI
jgi:hypothetical protein